MRNSKAASDIDRQIAARIRLARLETGMSQEKLAEALGITFQQVQKYEKGLNRISAGRLREIADTLGREVTWFFEEMPTFEAYPTLSKADLRMLRNLKALTPETRRAIDALLASLAPATETVE
ncbi:helix-turn-helix domain-containing protein [Jiella sp. MQZ9-1]|uniref:Helix-turn-helix domain-containing protein n=1 Tax=Jiella flava TaxID=2816857 RepID=A0A939FWK1_9HYPH|nr:helix-turn-helix domain-containing protein [Jiella flava]MBO0662805.1 helix-turn-helix domain-containing protein [Jiella flava]MCD2471226.1 helix-turn-helix domain-containing protein [Jiella flava]